MRILFISWWFPYPPDNGSRIRNFNLIRHLAAVGHEVTLIAFSRDHADAERVNALSPYCREVRLVPGRTFRPRSLRGLVGFFSVRPRSVVDLYEPKMAQAIQQAMGQNQFDVMIASEIGAATNTAFYLLGMEGIPKVIEDLELGALWEHYKMQCTLRGRARYGLMWWKTLRFVARLLRDFDGCTIASEQERAIALEIAPGYRHLAVVPNGVDLDFYQGDFGTPTQNTLVFTGALTYDANLDAMDFFLREVFPHVQMRRSDVTLRITGKIEGIAIERLPLSQSVILTGYLDDIRPCVTQSWACIVPLRIGGGTRLKILEAMALGTPVVATSKGAEGLEVTPEEDILIADEPVAFAEQVVRLLEDAALRAKLSQNGRQLVRERYDWQIVGRQFNAFLEKVVAESA